MILAYRDRGMDLFNMNFNLNLQHSLSVLPHFNGIINSVFLSPREDSISWMLSENKEFSIKSYYDILNAGGLRLVFKTIIWKSATSFKVKSLLYLLSTIKYYLGPI